MTDRIYRAPFTGKIETAEDIGLHDEVLCASIESWIADALRPRKSINTSFTNYGLKHLAEQDLGCYVHPMLMHELLVRSGFKSRQKSYSPNYHYNISSASPGIR